MLLRVECLGDRASSKKSFWEGGGAESRKYKKRHHMQFSDAAAWLMNGTFSTERKKPHNFVGPATLLLVGHFLPFSLLENPTMDGLSRYTTLISHFECLLDRYTGDWIEAIEVLSGLTTEYVPLN